MPKAIDLRLHGISFEDAMKHLANTSPPKLKKTKLAKRKPQKRNN